MNFVLFCGSGIGTHCFRTVYFEESWTELIVATPPYNQETIQRTVNGYIFSHGNHREHPADLHSPHWEPKKIVSRPGAMRLLN